jgi:hypothetical protein
MDTGKDRDTMRIQSQVLQGFDGACVWATGGGYDDASHGVSRHFQQVIRIGIIWVGSIAFEDSKTIDLRAEIFC